MSLESDYEWAEYEYEKDESTQHGGGRAGEMTSIRKNAGHSLRSQKRVEGSNPPCFHHHNGRVGPSCE